MIRAILYSLIFSTVIMSITIIINWLYPPIKYDKKLIKLGYALSSLNIFMLAFIDGMKYGNIAYLKIYTGLFDYSITWLILSSIIYVIITDCLLWLQHYIFHTKILYKWFHYVHHKFTYPTAFDFTAIHPVDMLTIYFSYHIVALIIPVYAGTIYLYGIVGNFLGLLYHGQGLLLFTKNKYFGKYFKNIDIEFHNIHHLIHSSNYGIGLFTTFWDKLFGTYKRSVKL
ncbi:MAG: putative lathosterol oxidase-like [Edafosvirus sp.]|uniref:Putative lathosterol oxidase-like n=1 Tax=Edafosvirus sp. TaxID=2487765 RepID=A0A3G5A014_9VIRU|nr:MAG: putative lathosterol oxidase-like [Edafosvirus sp.]